MMRESNFKELMLETKEYIDFYFEDKKLRKSDVSSKHKENVAIDGSFSFMTMDDIGSFMKRNKKENETLSDMLNRLVGETTESCARICRKVGLNETLLSKYINGSRKVNKINLLKLVVGFECSINDSIELLELAGYSYNRSSNLDLIVMAHLFDRDYSLRRIDHHLVGYGETRLFNELLYKDD